MSSPAPSLRVRFFRLPSRRTLWLVLGGIALTLLITTITAYWWWQRSLPQITGSATIHGLTDKVEIYRDHHGVPSIFAANRADALRALGYLHASERFFAMEMNRRAGQGRLAEVIGADMLPTDKFLRTLNLYDLSASSFQHFRPDTQALFNAYAEGVNEWLQTHHDKLPLEITLLGIKPAPWQPADSLVWGKLMGLQLSANLRDELRRAAMLAKRPLEIVERLSPRYPQDQPITTQPDFTPVKPLEQPPVKPSPTPPLPKQKRTETITKPEWQQTFTTLAEIWPFQAAGASNEWVVSGVRSATGKPLLANDPHLALTAPIMWYLARLVTPEGELTGGTVPGLPLILLGQNSHIAWGLTTTNSDVQDVFIETLDPKNPQHYLHGTASLPFTTRTETIKVKDAADVTITIRTTRHGAVISDVDADAAKILHSDNHVLALAFTGLSDADTTAQGLMDLNIAKDWPSFQTALSQIQTPPQNIVYADRAGHIGFTNVGLVPVRKQGDGRYPVDGASGNYDWRGMIPFTQVPRLFNPAGGTIVNANNQVAPAGLYWLGREWETPHRAQRITDLLKAQKTFTMADFATMQRDVMNLAARDLLPQLLQHLQPKDQREQQAVAMLRNWDFMMAANRPEPLLYEWWLLQLYHQMVRPVFGDALPASSRPYPMVLQGILARPAGWCDTVLTIKSSNCAPQIQAAFTQTLADLTKRYGQDIKNWQWGKEHFAPLENKVLDHAPLFKPLFGLQHPSDGGNYTVERGGNSDETDKHHPLVKTHGSGYRAIYDLAEPSRSRFMIATGQAGHPLSPHYDDLLPLWQRVEGITITGSAAELAAAGAKQLNLMPKAR